MKSKEEILNEFPDYIWNHLSAAKLKVVSKSDALEAMDQYAAEVSKGFAEWIINNGWEFSQKSGMWEKFDDVAKGEYLGRQYKSTSDLYTQFLNDQNKEK